MLTLNDEDAANNHQPEPIRAKIHHGQAYETTPVQHKGTKNRTLEP